MEEEPPPPDFSYEKVIFPHRHFLGLWKADVKVYGGLLLVKCVYGGVEGWELLPPRMHEFLEPPRIRKLFRIAMSGISGMEDVTVSCLGEPNEFQCTHEATLELDGFFVDQQAPTENVGKCALYINMGHSTPQSGTDAFEFKCTGPETHYDNEKKAKDLEDWIRDEFPIENNEDYPFNETLMKRKFFSRRKANFHYRFTRLDVSAWDRDLDIGAKPMAPGLFKGTYSVHGLEIVQLAYELDTRKEPQAKVIKITGDPNIPAGQMTFKAKLNFPLKFSTMDEQNTKRKLETVKITKVMYTDQEDNQNLQPFVLPRECVVEYGLEVPDYCLYRFRGRGQIAEDGFRDAELVKGQWIVFSEDLFGFLFLDIGSLCMYHRILDLDPHPPPP